MRYNRTVVFLLALLAPTVSALAQTIDGYNPLPNGSPTTLAIQADGRAIIGGVFQTVGSTPVSGLARLNVDGSVDASFATAAINGEVKSVAMQPDGKILIGGDFTAISASAYHSLARLNANGTLDAGFVDPNLNDTVWSIAIQPDGKVLVAGDFTASGASSRGHLARFTSSGALDGTFPDPQICSTRASSVALQSNGAIVVAGYFAHIGNCSGSTYYDYLARFSPSGVLDTAFPASTPAAFITSMSIGPDDSIYVNDAYPTSDSSSTRPVAKLTANGSLVSGYGNVDQDGSVDSFVLQPNGKVVFGGTFQNVGGQARHALARLNADGTLDTTFGDLHFSLDATHPNGYIYGLAAQTDGNTIAIGNFTLTNGQSRQYMARVVTGDAVSNKLTGQASGGNVIMTWTRTGDGPELAQAPTLLHSSNGVNYSAVGTMTRIASGWKYTAPYNVAGAPFYLKASGYTSGGAGNGSPGRIDSPVYVSDRIFADGFE